MSPWNRRVLLSLAIASGAPAGGCSSTSPSSDADASQTTENDASGRDGTVSDARAGDAKDDAEKRDAKDDAEKADARADAKAGDGGDLDGDAFAGDASGSDASDTGASSDGSDTGASSDAAGDGAGGDVSNGDASSSDASNEDASGGGDASEAGSASPHLLVAGATLTIEGVTSDNYVLYYDSSARSYSAIPLGGGAATTIYTAPSSVSSGYAAVIGKVTFVWSWNSSYVGTLTTWSSGMSQGASLTTSGLAYLYQTEWASDDSQHIAYLQSTTPDASASSLYGANADGTGVTLLLSNIDTNSSFSGQAPGCFPRVVFRGDYAVVSSCGVGDAGLTPTIQSFSISNGWAPAALVPDSVDSFQYNPLDRSPFTFPFAVDPAGGQIAAASASSGNGAVQVFPIDGGAAGTVVDPTVQLTPSLSFTGSVTAPWSILYNNSAGALMQANATSPTPQTLVDGGVNYFNALSNDGNWMLVSNQANVSQGWFSDLSLVSTKSPGAPVLVASSSQYGGLGVTPSGNEYGGVRGFTADSTYALTTTNLTQNSYSQWIGYLRSMLVTAPYTTKLLTNGYMVGFAPLSGSKVLVTDNFQAPDAGSGPTVDIDVVDPASAGGPVNVVKGVLGDNGVSSDKTQIAYTVGTGAAPGIYVSALP